MKRIWIYLFLSLSTSCFCQNLVPNPSFEQYDTCPSSFGQLNNAIGWSSFRNSPDYFNSCDTTNLGVPKNLYDYQNARTGNAYAGFYAMYIPGNNGREFLGAKLTQTLTIGQKYFVSLYLNRVANNLLSINIAINKLGVRFSTISYSYQNPAPIDNISQVYSDSLISDTLNWVKISGSFTADSAFQYVSVGDFFTDSETKYFSYDSAAAVAYYFVDDIKISTDSNYVNEIEGYNIQNFIKVFPNPTRDWLEIEANDLESLLILDAIGRIIYISNSKIVSPVQINISSYPKGIYLLRTMAKGHSVINKIIIQ